jgi:hypothetical protein
MGFRACADGPFRAGRGHTVAATGLDGTVNLLSSGAGSAAFRAFETPV